MNEKSCLLIQASDGATHLLPYGHFLHAVHRTYDTKNDGLKEVLELRFAIHLVVVEGNGLSHHLEKVQNFTLERLARSSTKANISSISVLDVHMPVVEQDEPENRKLN